MEQLEIVLLILLSTACLLILARRARATRRRCPVSFETSQSLGAHPVTRHNLRFTQSGGQRHIILDGVEIRDPKAITDPALRAALARGEEALAEVERTLKAPLRKS